MAAAQHNLASFLFETADSSSPDDVLDGPALSDLHANIEALPDISWPAAKSTLADALTEALDVKLIDIVGGAWSKLKQLQEYRDPQRHPPEEVSLVPLIEHKVRSIHAPAIDLLSGETVIAHLVFNVVLVLKLDGVTLKISGGRIVEIVSGTCQGTGILKYAEQKLAEKSTPAWAIPGSVSLGTGFRIPHLPETPR
ncbi:MAG: hypothetical protein ACE363_09300 [Alphaproteobacteria bacterium]